MYNYKPIIHLFIYLEKKNEEEYVSTKYKTGNWKIYLARVESVERFSSGNESFFKLSGMNDDLERNKED